MLELEGLVVMVPRKGAHVAEVTAKDIGNVLEVRAALDGLATSLATQRITEEEIERLHSIQKEFVNFVDKGDLQGSIKKDVEFHDFIYKTSRNEKLTQIAGNLWEQVQRFRVIYMRDTSNAKEIINEHNEILDAIGSKDSEKARLFAQKHIKKQEEKIIAALNKEAEAYEKLINEYNMTQEEISKSVGKSRPAIANAIRLLSLQDRLKEMVINGSLTSGHARTLLSISDTKLQLEAAEYIVEKQLSVRETEKFVKQLLNTKTSEEKDKKNKKDTERAEAFKYVEEKFIETFGTKVKIMDSNNKGKIVIEYYSLDELNRIVELVEGFNKT
jgi:DNA-binding GntR family transcriptional regulator